MTGGPGSGPAHRFNDQLRQQYLDAVAEGMRLQDAAAHVGISLNIPQRHARTDNAFASALQQARAQGKKLRDDAKEHGEAHYNNQHCRHPKCVEAIRTGRAGRREREAEDQPAELHDIRPQIAPEPPFPLARAS
ncbi:hypothetical protein AB0D12_31495 [Streptomyces sp. NPDC048479]|uniref:hypothetical protein n=1 Tax=Streptomyces sp. NPDC048479 TaxID=3154725 RepID=UPI003449C6A7